MTVTVTQRTWEQPSPRLTWADANAKLRAAVRKYSTAELPDALVDDAIRRVVDQSHPRAFCQELWQVSLPSYTNAIQLPWALESENDVVICTWTRSDDLTWGEVVPDELWTVDGDQWRWLGGSQRWPSYGMSWAMRVVGRPRTIDQEPVYCTVNEQFLITLGRVELYELIAVNNGTDEAMAMQQAVAMREAALKHLPKMKRPARVLKEPTISISGVVWETWAQTNITLADLGYTA